MDRERERNRNYHPPGESQINKTEHKRISELEAQLSECKHELTTLVMDFADMEEELRLTRKENAELQIIAKAERDNASASRQDAELNQIQLANAIRERNRMALEIEALKADKAERMVEIVDLRSQVMNTRSTQQVTSPASQNRKFHDVLELVRKVQKQNQELRSCVVEYLERQKSESAIQLEELQTVIESNVWAMEAEFEREKEVWMRAREELRGSLEEAKEGLKKVQEQKMWGSSKQSDEDSSNSDALAQATYEKVSLLLLLSQQEERYLLEKDSVSALEAKADQLTSKLNQATREKVEALMAVAELRQELTTLKEKASMNQPTTSRDPHSKLGFRFSSRAILSGWSRATPGHRYESQSSQESASAPESENEVFLRMKAENAAFLKALDGIDEVAQLVQKMRKEIQEVLAGQSSSGSKEDKLRVLSNIEEEAARLKAMLSSSSLPVSSSDGGPDNESEAMRNCTDISLNTRLELYDLLLFLTPLVRSWLV